MREEASFGAPLFARFPGGPLAFAQMVRYTKALHLSDAHANVAQLVEQRTRNA